MRAGEPAPPPETVRIPPLLRWVLNLSLTGQVHRCSVYNAVAHLCHMEMLCEESANTDHVEAFQQIINGDVDRAGANHFLQLVTVPITDQYDRLPGTLVHRQDSADSAGAGAGAGATPGESR